MTVSSLPLAVLTEWVRAHTWYGTAVICAFVLLSVFCLFIYKAFKACPEPEKERRAGDSGPVGGKCCRIVLAIVSLLSFALLALLLYTCWMRGDEWGFAIGDHSFFSRAIQGASGYFFRNSRLGELVGVLVTVSECKWQVFILNPLFAVALPFALHRLFRKPGESMATPQGIAFFCFAFYLGIQSACLSPWRNFTCFAASVNYLWPSVIIIYFLSLFNPSTWQESLFPSISLRVKCILLAILGLYCGCSVECLSVTLLPVLTLWVLYRAYKRLPVPVTCKIAYYGFLWGTFLLFASPSLYRRAEREGAKLAIDVSTFSPEQLSEFVRNLSWEQVHGLTGGSMVTILKGIPLSDHVFFFPFLANKFLQCCSVGCVCLLILVVIMAFKYRSCRKSDFAWVLGIFLLGWGCASSYLVQCIPMRMSFLPPSFIVLAAASLALVTLYRLKCRVACWIVTMAVMVLAFVTFIPAGIEAWPLKKVEDARYADIHRQIEAGNRDVRVVMKLDKYPSDPLCLTDLYHFPVIENPQAWSNDIVAGHFHVRSISQSISAGPIPDFSPEYGPCYTLVRAFIHQVQVKIFHSTKEPFGQ
ncbi:MAG: DUF6056 family protein [Akkermansia sp.]|nr:DUF6056 family protein [Akkermansia sp.]